jgi:hypothetical protein
LLGALACALLSSACGRGEPPSKAHAWGVCVDGTESYFYTRQALDMSARLVEDVARPGDVVYVRWILGEETPGSPAILLTAQLPAMTRSPVDPVRLQQDQEVRHVRQQAAAALRNARPPLAEASNMMTCIAKSADLLRASQASGRTLLLLSDLEENVTIPSSPDLQGIRVLCALCQAERSQAAIASFRSAILTAGAAGFDVYDVQLAPAQILRNLKEVRNHG